MNLTMPKGFMSPKNSLKKNGVSSDLKKQEIQDVVKSYFDKNGASPTSPSLRMPMPTSVSGQLGIKSPEIDPTLFSGSP